MGVLFDGQGQDTSAAVDDLGGKLGLFKALRQATGWQGGRDSREGRIHGRVTRVSQKRTNVVPREVPRKRGRQRLAPLVLFLPQRGLLLKGGTTIVDVFLEHLDPDHHIGECFALEGHRLRIVFNQGQNALQLVLAHRWLKGTNGFISALLAAELGSRWRSREAGSDLVGEALYFFLLARLALL